MADVNRAQAQNSLVTLHPGTSATATYCFHPFGGSVAVYGQLSVSLGRSARVFGLQATGLSPGQHPDRTIEQMADRYAAEIAASNPTGHMLFAGYSMGGLLAVETARRLASRPTIVVIDCDPAYQRNAAGGAWHILTRQVLDLDLPEASLNSVAREEALARVLASAAAARQLPARFSQARLGRIFDVCQANEHAAAVFRPAWYETELNIVRPDRATESPAKKEPWRDYVGHVLLHYVPGDHKSLLSGKSCEEVVRVIRGLSSL